jgi:putative redox protein
MLAAALDLPAGEPSAFALLAHCFTCGKDVLAAKRIAEGLTKRGIAVLRFDFTGIGASEGEFANSNFSSNIADLVQAADYLRTSHRAPAIRSATAWAARRFWPRPRKFPKPRRW